jgi:hypothetical protein
MSIYDTLSLYIFVDYCFRIMSSLFQQTTSLFISRNSPAVEAYGVYISQLIRNDMGCAQYSDVLYKAKLLTQNLLKQGYVAHMLISSINNSTLVITNWLAVAKYPCVIC